MKDENKCSFYKLPSHAKQSKKINLNVRIITDTVKSILIILEKEAVKMLSWDSQIIWKSWSLNTEYFYMLRNAYKAF